MEITLRLRHAGQLHHFGTEPQPAGLALYELDADGDPVALVCWLREDAPKAAARRRASLYLALYSEPL